jgi:hypothetical protein
VRVQRVAMRLHEPPERFLVTALGRLEFHPAMSFPAAGGSYRYATKGLELVESRATAGGVTIHVHRPTGRPQYST